MTGANERYDLIVVGAGINGSGIARDAALRGLRPLLLDKGDIGGGTTSWSTRLIHGGLRYLEHGEVGLVRESLRERERLLRIASHLVEPLPLLLPIYAGDRRGPVLIRAGMIAYDALSFDKSLPHHRMLGRDETLQRVPGLNPLGLRGAALYFDGQITYPERLAVENAIDARDNGAEVRLYTEVEELLVAGGKVVGVSGRDLLADEPFEARAPLVVNVAGAWVDAVLRGVGTPTPLMGGTKGSHLVVGPFPGAPPTALYLEAKRDGRPFFVIPWNGQYLIGTTDERYGGDLDRIVASDDEIDYLLAETNRVVPTARLARPDVLWTYAGVRPLPHQPAGATGAITRRHVIHDHAGHGGPAGLVSIVGGKLTTYRELAEQTVDAAGRLLARALPRSTTGNEPLPGASGDGTFPVTGALELRSTNHLRRVYGSAAGAVVARAVSPGLLRPFDPVSGAIGAEIPYAFEREGARTLADALLRRTMVGLGPEVGIGADLAAAEVARQTLGWSEERAEREIRAYREFVSRYRPRSLGDALSPDSAADHVTMAVLKPR